ncbi:MAG: hypothetical protein G01um101429_676 [Parcubacteria group bacterium Gr01-1014_29]|nr:MAG: hypothetical protein G01um101429_676 [Parcubacteria group bacterium Gr01-1014_29]
MKQNPQEQFGPYAAPEERTEEPSRYQGMELLKQAPPDTLPGRKFERSDKTHIPIDEIITALNNGPDALDRSLSRTSPEFREKISATRWNKRVFSFFEKCATAEKPDWPVYAFQVQRDMNRSSPTVRNEFSSVLAEWHAAQLLERLDKNAESARAHYALDAGAGVDLLFHLPEKNSEGSFFAIQVKKDTTRSTPKVESIEEAINTEADDRIRKGFENCRMAAVQMSKHSSKKYIPLVMRVPTYDKILGQKLVDNRTLAFANTPDVDKWNAEMVSFFRDKKYKKETYGR